MLPVLVPLPEVPVGVGLGLTVKDAGGRYQESG